MLQSANIQCPLQQIWSPYTLRMIIINDPVVPKIGVLQNVEFKVEHKTTSVSHFTVILCVNSAVRLCHGWTMVRR
jgi:hypothetical protein